MLFKPDAVFPESLQSLEALPPVAQLKEVLLRFYDAIMHCDGTLDRLKELEAMIDPEQWLKIVTGTEEQSEYEVLGHPFAVAAKSGEFSQLTMRYLLSFPPVREYAVRKITESINKQESLELPTLDNPAPPPSEAGSDSDDVFLEQPEKTPILVRASSVKSSFYNNPAIQEPIPDLEDSVTPEPEGVKITSV